MQKEEYWKNFLTSGKVSDYLGYCRVEESAECNTRGNAGASAGTDEEPEDKRKHNAGFY